MAASLRSTRSVAKAVLPDRMGRMDYRFPVTILIVNARAGIPFLVDGPFPLSLIDRVNGINRRGGMATCQRYDLL